MKSIEL